MAEEQEGEGAYGTVHVMEQEMREKGMGAFGETRRKKAPAAPQNKAEVAPENKAGEPSVKVTRRAAKRK